MLQIQLLLIPIITILYAILFVYRPKIAFLALFPLVALMHKELFSLYQWDYLPIRFAVLGLGFGLLIKLIKTNHFWSETKKIYLKDRFLWVLIAVFITKLLSSLISGTILQSPQFLLFFINITLIYLVAKYIYYIEEDKNNIHKYIAVYMIVGFIAVLFAYLQLALRLAYDIKIGAIWPVANNLPRLGSTFWDVNHFGGFLVTLIPLYFVYTFASKKFIYKGLSFIALGSSAFMFFLTQSRSSWLGLTLAVLVAVSLLVAKKYLKPVLLFVAGLIIMSGVFFAYLDFKDLSVRQKIASYMHYRLDSTDTHVMLLEGAVQVYINNPLVGVGPGNFNNAFRETETSEKYFEREPKLKSQEVPPHSVWGEVISETGYLGFAVYLFMAIFTLLTQLTIFYKDQSNKNSLIALGFFMSLAGIFTTGIFYSYNLEFYWLTIFLSVLFALSVLKDKYNFEYIFGVTSHIKWLPFAAVTSIAVFFIFLNLGGVALIQWDESIYATVAKNIVLTNDWLNLRWDDLKEYWFEKPPLYMWLTAATYLVTGFDEFGTRLWPAIFGVLGIVLTYIFGTKLYGRFAGITAALILSTTAHYIYYARNGILDVPVSFFILFSVFLFYLGFTSNQKSKYLLYIAAGVSVGLGVMTKAIVGLIPLGIILIFMIVNWIVNRKRFDLMGFILIILSSILVFGPWHFYSYLTHGDDFIDTYLFKHIFDRATEGLNHEMPLLWYTDVILTSFRIWVFPLLLGIIVVPFRDKKNPAGILLLTSIVFILLFFSIPTDKLLWYIVPIYPFLALFTARTFELIIEWLHGHLKFTKPVSHHVYRVGFTILLFIFTPFYFTNIRDKIFFEDVNHDVAELTKIHNQLYPVKSHPDLQLRYATAPESVLRFYSDHEPKFTDKDKLVDLVKNADPDEFYTFLITSNRFYEMRGRIQSEVKIPTDFRIRASSGQYVIARSYSRIDLLREKISDIEPTITDLINPAKTPQPLSEFDQQRLNALIVEYKLLIDQLAAYEYIHTPVVPLR